ncbi:hypothetical protein ACIOJD_13290 [Streptomyces sp. NPDC088116]|uniref:hypothetical protein n=1 Tax=Streptomyces sp. NPDC088116 TaxID=3365825 RepID=UPI0037F4E21C
MGESHEPMRWDERARGGAGGWVRMADSSPPAGPPPGGDRSDNDQRPVPGRFILFALAGGLAVAAIVLIVSHYVRSAPAQADHPAGSASSRSESLAGAQPPAGSASVETGSPRSQETPATAEDQARAVDALLERSSADREKVLAAVSAVEACESPTSVTEASEDLNAAAARREDLVTRLGELPLDKVDSGPLAADSLRAAWQHSADADRAFAGWADDADGCAPGDAPRTASYRRGVESSDLATAAKEKFLSAWSPIASRYGLPERDRTRI